MNWTYEKAGVDLKKAQDWVDVIKKIVSKNKSSRTIGGIGGFAGLYRLDEENLIAACTDGVGTKVEIARILNRYDTIGQDLVAMNVNDLVTCGAKPLFFLDYIACSKLDIAVLEPIIQSIADACYQSGCVLLGGETAEMPDVYDYGKLDLAGFAVGIVKEKDLITGQNIQKGDIVLGLKSSGLHSNGYSLARKVLLGEDTGELDSTLPILGEKLGDSLLKPTRLYVRQAMKAAETGLVKGMAHITGGGLKENIERILPPSRTLFIDFNSWERPSIFKLISSKGVSEEEMRKVFNLGIGFVFIVSPSDVPTIKEVMKKENEDLYEIGEISR
ncbi:phosphoribosylformylglycinamidine cyclo-ligase [Thermovirga lienii DSM 17291]|uniref:Phosphoribosylformylglycinamidine cyclo-ligase n=1 Tax=Thermovirga lienii (strain ATCC BAA-1197 / DSM 17291 / Cas60314) TaxID=580340 RepID=G7V598_THELD|nr:phosphoribosylformylglycinamidine cyclo-ligase [Thermovirga lienii]AER66881.1 phosphoribosylformylglycinamidine cyclo-ligase [Thermovirga lienii DSM 17291]MDN5318100.1 phosphoribosylformylglycinamidine cyclo-ligase [Thermovirga sp.]MDN5367311.1 phosphoribosylformylglycinamidine cyclo-ligase [Thermovirga sp.]HCD71954.1 phosphoribosylformylglycinamidine cyclo-ligase [Thermovirga lienii]